MAAFGSDPARTPRRTRRRRVFAGIAGGVVALALIGGTVAAIGFARAGADDGTRPTDAGTTPSASPTPTPTPLTPEEQLLAGSTDPAACAVSFAGDGIADAPMLQTQGALYAGLPIPARDGLVFAGWYATPEDAAGLAVPARVNGSDPVVCADQRVTLHAAWMSPEQNAAENARIRS